MNISQLHASLFITVEPVYVVNYIKHAFVFKR